MFVSTLLALLGSGMIALAVRWTQLLRAIPLAISGTGLVFYGLVEVFAPDRVRGALMPTLLAVAAATLLSAVLLAMLAFKLWGKHATKDPRDELRANLAIALGAGAAVTSVILLIQTTVQVIDYQQNLANQRQAIKLALAIESDLSGLAAPLDPADGDLLDLSNYWLRGKKMALASLNDVRLRGVNFVFTDLSGALLRRANLSSDELGQRTDLRAASLYWSDLTEATLDNASLVDADLRRAYLCGVDLTQANLTRTDLREAVLNVDPNTGKPCTKPGRLPPRANFPTACWPDEASAHDGCGAEARLVVCQRDGRVPQRPAPARSEARCGSRE